MNSLQDLRDVAEEHVGQPIVPVDFVERAVRAGRTRQLRRRVATVALVGTVGAAVAVAFSLSPGSTIPTVPTPTPPPVATNTPTTAPTTPGDTTASPTGEPTASATPTGVAALPLGAPPAVPYVAGSTLIDGDRRIQLPGPTSEVTRVGDSYAVVVNDQLSLVAPDGTSTVLDTGVIYGLAAGPTGSGITLAWGWYDRSADVGEIRTLVDGAQQSARVKPPGPHAPFVKDIEPDGRVVFSWAADPGGPPEVWDGAASLLVPEPGRDLGSLAFFASDLDLVGIYDQDPYNCVTAYGIADGQERWHTCLPDGVADAITPDGQFLIAGTAAYEIAADFREIPLDVPFFPLDSVLEDSRHVLLAAPLSPDVVRCDISTGACERVPIDDAAPAEHSVWFAH